MESTSTSKVNHGEPVKESTGLGTIVVSQRGDEMDCPSTQKFAVSNQNIKPYGSLTVLPLEIILEIVKSLRSFGDYRSIAMTNSFFMAIVEPYLYSHAHFECPNDYRSFQYSVSNHPHRCSLVRTMHWINDDYAREYCDDRISCHREECAALDYCDGHSDIDDVSMLSKLSNLRDLEFILPEYYKEHVWDLFKKALKAPILGSLESCTVEFVGSTYAFTPIGRRIEDFLSIFQHPTLKTLKLRRLDLRHLVPGTMDLSRWASSSALHSLSFLECDMDVSAFAGILAVMTDLKCLEIIYDMSSSDYTQDPPRGYEYLPAMQTVAHSLEKLQVESNQNSNDIPFDLSSFPKLKILRTDQYDLWPCSNFANFLPPNVEVLAVPGGNFTLDHRKDALGEILREKKKGVAFNAFREIESITHSGVRMPYFLVKGCRESGVTIRVTKDLTDGGYGDSSMHLEDDSDAFYEFDDELAIDMDDDSDYWYDEDDDADFSGLELLGTFNQMAEWGAIPVWAMGSGDSSPGEEPAEEIEQRREPRDDDVVDYSIIADIYQ